MQQQSVKQNLLSFLSAIIFSPWFFSKSFSECGCQGKHSPQSCNFLMSPRLRKCQMFFPQVTNTVVAALEAHVCKQVKTRNVYGSFGEEEP